MLIFIFGNTIVGLVMAYTLAVYLKHGVQGIWFGMAIGGGVTILLFAISIFRMDLEK